MDFRFFIIRTKGAWGGAASTKWALVDATNIHKVLGYTEDGTNAGIDWATGIVEGHSIYGTEAQKERQQEGIETAPKVSYTDFSKFMDTATGKVTDVDGMVAYLKTHGLESMSPQEIIDSLPNMPGVNISAADIAGAKAKQTSDIYGIQTGMTEARAGGSAAAGAAGIYSPTSTGFGGKAEDAYAQLGAMGQQDGGDVYGLAEDKEQELVDWMAKITTS